MSTQLSLAWDRPASSGDSEHWLSVSLALPPDDGPAALVVAADTSTSMVGERLARARAAVSALVQARRPSDRVLVLGFGSAVQRVAEVAGGVDLTPALGALVAGGKTRLDLALSEAARWLNAQPGRRHLLLLTDGDPTDADGRRAETGPLVAQARALARAGVRITVVGLGSAEGYDAGLLRELADAAGGVAVVNVAPAQLVERTGEVARRGDDESSRVELSIDSTELTVLEAWRLDPRVQPLPLQAGAVTLPVGASGAVLLRTRLVPDLGRRRGERQVGTLHVRTAAGLAATAPLLLHIVGPGSPDRALLNPEVDRGRVRVELARTAAARAAAGDREDQLHMTRRLADLADQLGDPRATRRVARELQKLAAGDALSRDEREGAIEALREGTHDG